MLLRFAIIPVVILLAPVNATAQGANRHPAHMQCDGHKPIAACVRWVESLSLQRTQGSEKEEFRTTHVRENLCSVKVLFGIRDPKDKRRKVNLIEVTICHPRSYTYARLRFRLYSHVSGKPVGTLRLLGASSGYVPKQATWENVIAPREDGKAWGKRLYFVAVDHGENRYCVRATQQRKCNPGMTRDRARLRTSPFSYLLIIFRVQLIFVVRPDG